MRHLSTSFNLELAEKLNAFGQMIPRIWVSSKLTDARSQLISELFHVFIITIHHSCISFATWKRQRLNQWAHPICLSKIAIAVKPNTNQKTERINTPSQTFHSRNRVSLGMEILTFVWGFWENVPRVILIIDVWSNSPRWWLEYILVRC